MTARNHERIEELLALAALEGLTPEQMAELRGMGVTDAEIEASELAAAAAAVALMGKPEPMPSSLRASILANSASHVASGKPNLKLRGGPPPSSRPMPRPASGGIIPWMGWLAAAAAIILAVSAWWPSGRVAPTPADAGQRRLALLAQPDVLQASWSDWGEAPAVAGVQGDVVWSPSRQEGYMRFRGLQPNDPAQAQYQLWIVDGDRGVPLQVPPVDGGVFDVADSGEVIVPINAKLPVGQAVAFAVTVEPPGGVVVSDQSKRVVVAMVSR